MGIVTSGGYSPTLNLNIGLAFVLVEYAEIGTEIDILIREKRVNGQITNRRFLHKGGKD